MFTPKKFNNDDLPYWPASAFPDEYFHVVGEIIVRFSQLDRELDYCIWCLLDVDVKSGSALLNKISSTAVKIEMISSLVKLHFNGHDLVFFTEHLGIVKSLNELRNGFVHDYPISWVPSTKEITYQRHITGWGQNKTHTFNDRNLQEVLDSLYHELNFFSAFRRNDYSWKTYQPIHVKEVGKAS
ncbi:MAG TPA: hypothetical protein VK974_07135 [Methylophilaceae bacterium]|nr:hypothetical protein [Methylophilaceae bacterium]